MMNEYFLASELIDLYIKNGCPLPYSLKDLAFLFNSGVFKGYRKNRNLYILKSSFDKFLSFLKQD